MLIDEYEHLDQVIEQLETRKIAVLSVNVYAEVLGTVAVSYTHLDVYKRQVQEAGLFIFQCTNEVWTLKTTKYTNKVVQYFVHFSMYKLSRNAKLYIIY